MGFYTSDSKKQVSQLFSIFLAKSIRRPPTGQHFSIWVLVCWSPCAWFASNIFNIKKTPEDLQANIFQFGCWPVDLPVLGS